MSEHIYVGNGKTLKHGAVKVALNLTKLQAAKEHFYEYNGEKFVNIVVAELKEERYGKTHSVKVDTWKPE